MPFPQKLFPRMLLAAPAVAFAVYCGGGGGGSGGDGPMDPPDPPPSSVSITTSMAPPPAFIPRTTDLAVGGTVTWTNTSPAPNNHDLVATTSNWQLGRTLSPGASFQTTIAQAGTYTYQCTIHPGMNGTIEVR